MDTKQFVLPRQQEEKIEPLALRPRDAAAARGISPSTLNRLTRAGEIPHVKINRLILYTVESLKRWLREREENGAGES